MADHCTHLRAADYEVRSASWDEAKRFIAEHHYSKGGSNTRCYAHGLYRRGESTLLGVASWLPPTRVAAESVNKSEWQKVLSLSRLAVRPDLPTNAASYLMGRSIRAIKQEGRFSSLVTYADEFMGHHGGIYYATNWIFVGVSKPYQRWEDKTGRQVSKKATYSRNNAEMLAAGNRMVGSYRKRKFVMHFDPARHFLTRMTMTPLAAILIV